MLIITEGGKDVINTDHVIHYPIYEHTEQRKTTFLLKAVFPLAFDKQTEHGFNLRPYERTLMKASTFTECVQMRKCIMERISCSFDDPYYNNVFDIDEEYESQSRW